MVRRVLFVLLLHVVCLHTISCVVADAVKPTDQRLFEDLGADLLVPFSGKAIPESDRRLPNYHGEDLSRHRASTDKRLSQVVAHMKAAQSKLEQSSDANTAIPAQLEALKGLEAMISELTERRNKCCGGQYAQPSSPKPDKSSGSANKAGTSPAQSAASTTTRDTDLSTDLAIAGELVKDLWGKLPLRQREQILQPLSEEFLPKYASEIEAYFRALADPTFTTPENP